MQSAVAIHRGSGYICWLRGELVISVKVSEGRFCTLRIIHGGCDIYTLGISVSIYQQYQANSRLDKGTSIDLQVSSGPEPAPEEPSEGDDKDKAALIGHTNFDFTRQQYQSSPLEDLKAVTDTIR